MTETTRPSAERRLRPTPATPRDLLHQLPAEVILDRMAIPILAMTTEGVLTYANPACAATLGYRDAAAILEQPLSALMTGLASQSPADCIATLREAGSRIVDWNHAEGFAIRTTVSEPLLLRATDPLLMFSLTDVTDVLWSERS